MQFIRPILTATLLASAVGACASESSYPPGYAYRSGAYAPNGYYYAASPAQSQGTYQNGVYYPPEGTVSGLTLETSQPVYVPRLDAERFPSAATRGFIDRGLKSLYAVPVVVHGE